MNNIKLNIAMIITVLAIPLCIIKCIISDPIAGGTETGDAVGILYNPNGSRAANAKVRAIPVDHNPITKLQNRITAIDSTFTNDSGEYSFDSLPEGYYNIFGDGASGLSYNDSFFVFDDTANAFPDDTLGNPGTLRGVVRLQPGDDSRTVIILVFGTKIWEAPTDSIGNFALVNMPEGSYHVRFLTTLDDYDPLDTNLMIRSGMDDTLSDTLHLPYTGIPIPTGLTLIYDTLKQIVTLNWDECDTSLVKGYNVYRKQSDSDFVKINVSLITENTHSDSSVIQNESYEYKITAVDNGDNEGKKSEGVVVVVESWFELTATYGNGIGTGDGCFDALKAIAVDDSGYIFIVDALNYRIQKFDSTGNFITKWGSEGNANTLFGREIRDIAVDSSGNIFVVDQGNSCIKKFDNNGNFLLKWGSQGTGDGNFQTPYRIAINGGYVYVGDWNGPRIQKFDLKGSFILSINVQNSVVALAVDDSLIVVADHERKLLLKYSTSGMFLDSISTITYQINNIFLFNKLIYVVTPSPRKVTGLDIDGNIVFKFFIEESIIGTPQDIFLLNNQDFIIAGDDGYFQKYSKK